MDAVNTWAPMLTSMAGTIGVLAFMMRATRETLEVKIEGLGVRLDAKIDGVESRLDARIDALESKVDGAVATLGAKLDHIDDVTDRRLTAIEVDTTIIKQKLVGVEGGVGPLSVTQSRP